MIHVLEALVVERKSYPRGNCILSVKAPEIARESRPGQFVMMGPSLKESPPSPLLKRALAVYACSKEDSSVIRLLLKVVGDGTRRLAGLEVGARASLIGPLGNGFTISPYLGKKHFLIVGGTGIASVYLLAKELLERGDEVSLLYGARSRQDLVGLEDFEQLGAGIYATTEDGSYGLEGLVTDGLRRCMKLYAPDDLNFFACGPMPMMQAVAELAQPKEIPCQISVEVKMACGFGVCLGCSVKTVRGFRLSCTHGPVFNVDQFLWEPPWSPSPGVRTKTPC